MKNTDRIHGKTPINPSSTQVQSAPPASPQSFNPRTVANLIREKVFGWSPRKCRATAKIFRELAYELDQLTGEQTVDIPCSRRKNALTTQALAMQMMDGLTPSEQLQAADEMALVAKMIRELNGVKGPKGFVVVRLARAQQKELRALALESGVELRAVVRAALCGMTVKMRNWATARRITGQTPQEQLDALGSGNLN